MPECTACKKTKPDEEFSKRSGGRHRQCKACLAERERARYREKRAEILQQKREYHQTNKSARNQYNREYHQDNRDRLLERMAEYQKLNPEVNWRNSYVHRSRSLGFEPSIVDEFTRADVIAAYGDACFHCGGPFEELDHYPIPVSKGGPHTMENVKPACKPCNRKTWREAT